jgi:hypothetical protein
MDCIFCIELVAGSTNNLALTHSMQIPADQVTQNLMSEISKIQEMLLSMNEGLREVKERVRELSEEKVKGQAPEPPTPSAQAPGSVRIVTPT